MSSHLSLSVQKMKLQTQTRQRRQRLSNPPQSQSSSVQTNPIMHQHASGASPSLPQKRDQETSVPETWTVEKQGRAAMTRQWQKKEKTNYTVYVFSGIFYFCLFWESWTKLYPLWCPDLCVCVWLCVCVCVGVNGSAASWEFSCKVSVNVSYTVVLAKYSSDFTQRQGWRGHFTLYTIDLILDQTSQKW